MRDAGYSGTPLAKKLGYKPGSVALLIAAPDDYRLWIGDLPEQVSFHSSIPDGSGDLIHLFATRYCDLEMQMPLTRRAMKPDGVLWVSWPKKASKAPTDITESRVRELALSGDLVDVKVCAVTEVWSGLKLVVRKALR